MSNKSTAPVVIEYAAADREARKTSRTIVIMMIALSIGMAAFALVVTGVFCHSPPPYPTSVKAAVGPNGVLSQAIKVYESEIGQYPSVLADLVTEPLPLRGTARWQGPYLYDPQELIDCWGRPYRYCTPGIHNARSFDLWSLGQDGQNGTTDDVGNFTR